MVSFQALRELVAYADSGSVSEVARALSENQPTVTRRLRQAFGVGGTRREAVLNVDDQNRLSGLTEFGQQILPAIRDLVRQYDRIADLIAGADDVQQAARLGVGAFGAEHYVPRLVAELRPETKGWLIESRVMRGRERILSVAEGRLDLAIVTHDPEQIEAVLSEPGQRRRALRIDCLATHTLWIVAAVETSWAAMLNALPANRAVSLPQLAQYELVGLDEHSGVRRQLEQWAVKAKRPLYFVPGTEAGGWHAALCCARAGLGAAVVPAVMLPAHAQSGLVARRLTDQVTIRDFLIAKPEPTHSLVAAVIEELKRIGSRLTRGSA